MKKTLCLLLILQTLMIVLLHAQTDKQLVLRPDTAPVVEKIAIPFSGMQVIDARFDQTNVGCVVKDYTFDARTKNKKEAVFPDALGAYLSQALSRFLQLDGSPDTLIILVKRFRLADYIQASLNLSSSHNRQFFIQLLLDVSVSFYRQHNRHYTKIGSVDDLLDEAFDKNNQVNKKDLLYYRDRALQRLLERVLRNRSWSQPSGPSFSHQDFYQGLSKRFELPVLKDSIYTAGIYRNFSEFINNKPFLAGLRFTYKNEKMAMVKDSSGTVIKPDAYWGICDGKNFYIIFRNRICRLERVDHSFKFPSFRNMDDGVGSTSVGTYLGAAGLIQKVANTISQSETFYLNMDKQEIYLDELLGKSSLKARYKEILK